MELILKQPKDKPPCICILFESSSVACKLNNEWVKDFGTNKFALDLEINGSNLDVVLKNPEFKLMHRYENVEFFPDKLSRFLYDTKKSELYSFCHVTAHYDKHIVALLPVTRKLWVLKIDIIKLKREM